MSYLEEVLSGAEALEGDHCSLWTMGRLADKEGRGEGDELVPQLVKAVSPRQPLKQLGSHACSLCKVLMLLVARSWKVARSVTPQSARSTVR